METFLKEFFPQFTNYFSGRSHWLIFCSNKIFFLQLLGIVCSFYLFYLFELLTDLTTYRSVQSWQEKKIFNFFWIMFKSTFRPNDFLKIYICCVELSNSWSIKLWNVYNQCFDVKKYFERNFFSFISSYTMDNSSFPKRIMFFIFRVFNYNNKILKA